MNLKQQHALTSHQWNKVKLKNPQLCKWTVQSYCKSFGVSWYFIGNTCSFFKTEYLFPKMNLAVYKGNPWRETLKISFKEEDCI